MSTVIETERLSLRTWRPDDLGPFTAMNADPRVMEYFPAPLTPLESKERLEKYQKKMSEQGFGVLAVELKKTRQVIGCLGLNIPSEPLPFSPCVEVGWRLDFRFWGHGYAQEGARATTQYGFEKLGLKEIVAFTTVKNQRSRRVMDAIGMTYDKNGDFFHPKLDKTHPLALHVIYRIKN